MQISGAKFSWKKQTWKQPWCSLLRWRKRISRLTSVEHAVGDSLRRAWGCGVATDVHKTSRKRAESKALHRVERAPTLFPLFFFFVPLLRRLSFCPPTCVSAVCHGRDRDRYRGGDVGGCAGCTGEVGRDTSHPVIQCRPLSNGLHKAAERRGLGYRMSTAT